mmetsp:Transcript_11535/g.23258  ORF Transcript_11535/g.23258 Transcript_11535/m.23258 type:complete len:301 (+) Transcript_11535:132-1034(+)
MAIDSDRLVGLITTLFLGIGMFAMTRLKLSSRSDDDSREETVTHQGSCHCQVVEFTIEAPKRLKALDCPSKIRYPHVHLPIKALQVLRGEHRLARCSTRGSGVTATCFFCSACGVHVYRTHDAESCDVNTDLLELHTVDDIRVVLYEGWPGANSSVVNVETRNATHNGGRTPPSLGSPHRAQLPSQNGFQSINNEQNMHSTNILAVQVYGAFADLDGRGNQSPMQQPSNFERQIENHSTQQFHSTLPHESVDPPLRKSETPSPFSVAPSQLPSYPKKPDQQRQRRSPPPSLEQLRRLNNL